MVSSVLLRVVDYKFIYYYYYGMLHLINIFQIKISLPERNARSFLSTALSTIMGVGVMVQEEEHLVEGEWAEEALAIQEVEVMEI